MAEPHRRTVRDLRRSNRSTVLTKLYFEGPLSRQELGPLTGLSSGSISNVAGELIADGLVEDAGSVDSDGGRPRTLLRVAPGSGQLVGVDVGETRVRVELFDLTLTELARADLPLPPDGHDVERVVRLIGEGLQQVMRQVPSATGLLGIGVGVPGIVDSGSVVHGQTIGWDAVPLGSLLRASGQLPLDIPLFIDNGAKTLGRAEMWFGAGRGARNAVVTLIGSGVGACVIADGVPYQGASSSAGEWGHTVLQVVGGRPCRCGSRGCLEAYVGAEALLERWRERGGTWAAPDEEGALAELLAAADAGPLLDETAEYLGAGLADLVNLFNPERIVVGGWAGLLLGPRLLPAVREAAASYALRHPFAGTSLVLGQLGPDAVTVGAATLPLARFLEAGGAVRGRVATASG
ncbi:ROK family transcriptional regulator [Streptomyces sp. TRM66268-LWL]|uniref:ROK family transcriptional regulator n=1 Tax=Streptomyces polyasparticus TaxID=2767826 RepID=A0ABR7SCB6_9ACTN|nr:ROK family transcriptional regulator [Streptomyces polyasparticus]MBC9712819.1 ROK family transcriptional regulator [Streptomyces polyasparticus]